MPRTRTRAGFSPGLDRTYVVSPNGLPSSSSTCGEFIKKGRLEKGLTQGKLACALGVGDQTVSNWERYETVPLRKRMGSWQGTCDSDPILIGEVGHCGEEELLYRPD